MKPELVVLTPKNVAEGNADRDALVKFFEDCAEKARRGELKKTLALIEISGFYEHTRIGFTYEAAVGMSHRMAYLLQKDWDGQT